MSPIISKTRFAPSPTGLLHLGNVRTALFNYLFALRDKGVFLLRMEDTDALRGEEKYEQALEEDLRWLFMDWQEGPGVDGGNGPYWQSQRGTIYQKFYDELIERKLVYPCFCSEHELKLSRKSQLAAGQPPRYSGKCRGLSEQEVQEKFSAGKSATLRFHVRDDSTISFDDKVRGHQEFKGSDIGDFIIRRSEGTPAFFFCNAVDDALMGISLVVRGEDHLTNTPRQLLILEALGLPKPEYAHISLVVGSDGAPLSKRHGSKTVRELRELGYMPLAIVNYLARLGHTFESNKIMWPDNLAEAMDTSHLHKSPARFDQSQLDHWQKEAIMASNDGELIGWLENNQSVSDKIHSLVPEDCFQVFIGTIRDNILLPEDAVNWAEIIFSSELVSHKDAKSILQETGSDFFETALKVLPDNADEFNRFSTAVGAATNKKGKALFMPLRAVLTGTLKGPEMAKMWHLIGPDRIRSRLEAAIGMMK